MLLRRVLGASSVTGAVRGRGCSVTAGWTARAHSTTTLQKAMAHCMDLVQASDPAQFAVIRSLPHKHRAPLFALRAFHIELRNVFESMSGGEPVAQAMRYQWWRDTIEGVYDGETSPQPIVQVLDPLILEYDLTRVMFLRMISAWESNVDRQPTTLNELISFAENSHSSHLYLALECCGATDDASMHAASHVGKAAGITYALQTIGLLLSKQRNTLVPEELFEHNKTSAEELQAYDGELTEGVRETIFNLGCIAKDHIHHARELEVDKAALPALLSLLPTDRYLDQLQRINFDVFQHQPSVMEPLALRWELMKHSTKGSF